MAADRGHDEWPTPQELFDTLNKEFKFTLDVAADDENHKCEKYFTKSIDGLLRSWEGNTVWCNPPYSADNIKHFLYKARAEQKKGVTSVLLLPAKTGNAWFHEYCLGADEIRFLRGRLTFGKGPHPAPFDSMVVVFRGIA